MGVFALAFCVVALPKWISSWRDLGGPLANPIRYWINARYFGTPPVDEHFPFFLFGDQSYKSRVALAGGVLKAAEKVVNGPLRHVAIALGEMSFANLWLLPLAFARDRRVRLSPAHLRLLTVTALAWLAYVAFFGLGFGEAIQFRHWAIPVSLSLVLGVDLTLRTFSAGAPPPLRRVFKWFIAVPAILVVVAIYSPGQYADTLGSPSERRSIRA